jgi:hypothetical protein
MRLQVSVERYSLPATNIVFTTSALGPSPATSSPDATIAQLLEDVNDIVPLESANWGLEDYAVEVNGYECLHFSPIDAVLRDDDQVVIRALKTQDLRSRRLGGRHQISSNGTHLIDGVAFGRQWLKKGGRPVVQIPPRKRRLKIEGPAEFPEEEEARLLALADVADDGSDEEEDLDFVDEDVDAHIDNESGGKTGPSFVIDTQPDLLIVARQEFQDADDEAQDSSEADDSEDDVSVEEVGFELSADLQALREEEHLHNAKVKHERQENLKQTSPNSGSDIRTSGRKRKLIADQDIQNGDEIEFNGFSSPLAKRSKTGEDHASLDSDSDSTSSTGSDSDEDSESGASLPPSKRRQSPDSSADSDGSSDSSEETSSSDSDSGGDAVSEEESSGSSSSSSQTSNVTNTNGEAPSKTTPKGNPFVFSQKLSPPSVNVTVTTRPPVPPGQGLKRTHYTNQRQKKRHRLKTLKEQGLLPENATFTDMAAYDEAQQTASLGPAAAVAKAIETKKQELLGRVEEHVEEQIQEQVQGQMNDNLEEQNPYMAVESRDKSMHSAYSDPRHTETPLTDASSEQLGGPHTPLHGRPAKDLIGSLLAAAAETKSEPPKPRARLDLHSTRNMIFNGLGVRKPKTAAAEQALREKLAKPVKGALPRQLFKDAAMNQDEGSKRQDDSPMPWQSKLVLSAVECELEGVTLKEPPFPFAQGWDEDANRRLRNNKKKGRNQRQYYAYDDDTFMDRYEEEREQAQDEDDSMHLNEAHGDDKLDQLTTKTSNLINEAREQLDTNASDLLVEEAEDLPRPDNLDTLNTLQQHDALPGAVIAYKEFDLNATNFQPEISGYRVARVEAVGGDGSLDLTLSKQDRKPPKVAKYDAETGKRILSRSEMWDVSAEANEDDGSRQLSFADLIEPKIVQISNTSKPATGMSVSGEKGVPNGMPPSALESAVIPESTVSDNFAIPSAQPFAQMVTAPETENEIDIDIATLRRTEISAMMKEAGFNSTLDSELLQPVSAMTDSAQPSSPALDVTGRSRNGSRETSPDPASEAQQTAPDTSGFDSPRFNGWSSSPPLEPEPDEVTEETGLNELLNSSQDDDTQQGESVGIGTLAAENQVTYPHISCLEHSALMQESSAARLRGGSGVESQIQSPSPNDGEGAPHLDDSSVEVVEEDHFDSLKSVVPPSVDQSQGARDPPARTGHATFLGGLDGQITSDDDELPSLARITSTARSRSSRASPHPVIRRGKERRRTSTSPVVESTASGSRRLLVKQSQSQIRLSQIPPGSQVVDLTFSSDPVSPGNSDGDYARTRRLPRSSNKGKRGTNSTGADESDALAASVGLGNRRLLKSKKAKS